MEEYEHNGKLYLIVVDKDGVKSSTYCGSATYTICGENFHVIFELYDEHEFQSDFFDQAERLKSENASNVDDVDSIINRVKDALSTLFPDFSGVNEQAAAYAKAKGITRDYEAYWYEDEESHWKDFVKENYGL